MATVLNLSQAATDEISQAFGGKKDFVVIAFSGDGTEQQFLPAGITITPLPGDKTPIDFMRTNFIPPAPTSPPGLSGVMKAYGWCNIGGIWIPC